MISFSLIITPVAGAIIGYITNDLAIKMLFHPHKAYYIKGHQIPFTPGLIPKEKDRMASSIAKMISEKLMTEEVLRENLLSDSVIEKISTAIINYGTQFQQDQRTIKQLLEKMISEEKFAQIESNTIDNLTELVAHKLTNANLGDTLATQAIEGFKEQSGSLVKFGISVFQEVLHEKVSSTINHVLSSNAKPMAKKLISEGIQEIANKKVCDLLEGKSDLVDAVRDMIIKQYKSTIIVQMPKILEALDIQQMVENKIKAMDVQEMEDLVFGVMNKELKYIVFLGALLGFFMGFVTLGINQLIG